ncbi:hypothetical protein ACEPAH_4747 [Sanghuangporus vaninii]
MSPPYDLYFTASPTANPRQCIILGEDVEPIFYRFETPEVFMTNKRTTVYRNQDEMVAVFDWSTDLYLGLCTIKDRQPFAMAMLVLPGSTPSSRAFFLNGAKFEWRRLREDQLNYDLYHAPQNQNGPGVRIASFRTVDQATPLGPAHGFLQYNFVQPALLLEALLALSLNRWLDMHAM